jgi:hypothetical protein
VSRSPSRLYLLGGQVTLLAGRAGTTRILLGEQVTLLTELSQVYLPGQQGNSMAKQISLPAKKGN